MTRNPQKTCPNLYHLIEHAEPERVLEFLGEDEFSRQAWLAPYRKLSTRERLMELLGEKKPRLAPLETEAARIITVSDRRGQIVLDELVRTKLTTDKPRIFRALRNDLERSLWAYLDNRRLFEGVESALHLRLYRRYGKHYQAFQADPTAGGDRSSREVLDAMIAEMKRRLDWGEGCGVERFELPAEDGHPASEMYIIYHPNAPTSARELREDGERRNIYFRPPGEATVIFTPATGAIEVRAETRIIRRQVAEGFAAKMLGRGVSQEPLDFREYDLSRFFGGFTLERPELPGFHVARAQVIRAEVSIGRLDNRLSLATTIDNDLDETIDRYPGLRGVFRHAVAIRFIEIAVRYRPGGEEADKTLNFSISDQNSCGLLGLPDEGERILGHRLLREWKIVNEMRALNKLEARQAFPILLDLWNSREREVPGSWLRERGIDEVSLTSTGFLEPTGWAEVDLLDDEDTGLVDAAVTTAKRWSIAASAPGRGVQIAHAGRHRQFSVNQGWLTEHLRKTLLGSFEEPFVEELGEDIFALGRLVIDGTAVPVYLARRLGDEKVLASSDVLLRGRADQGIGLVLSAGKVAFQYLGANALTFLGDHLAGADQDCLIDLDQLRAIYRNRRGVARGGQAVALVRNGAASGELFVPGRGSIQITGENRLTVLERLVDGHRRGRPVKTADLTCDIDGQSLSNIFGAPLWKRLQPEFLRSAGYGLWEIAT